MAAPAKTTANGRRPEDEVDIAKVSILGTESIHLGFHLAPYIASTVISTLPSSAYALVTDTHIASIHLEPLKQAFAAQLPSKSRFLVHTIPPGEGSKSRQGKAEIEDWLLENRCTRDTVLLALGGGVIGDLIGFVAATFMRGVKVVQIPTTLLAMVDSAVGGKTAIDTPLGKNLIGSFHQPSYIFIDASYLSTLPEREFVNGMAEVIKTAAIWDDQEFASLESGVDSIRSAVLSPPKPTAESPFPGQTAHSRTESQRLLLSVIRGSIAVKAHIVTTDEKETGLRNLVNFGHTVGHAIEAVVTPHMLHGECVSIGIRLEAEIARSLGILGNAAVGRLIRCLSSFGLPVSLSDPKVLACPTVKELTVDRLLDIMRVDKKNSGPEKKVVLLSRIGKTYEEKATGVADDVIAKVLAPAARVSPAPEGWTKEVVLATPGSKSISNRVLVLAALGEGEVRLKNLLHSDDTQVMMAALEAMEGAKFSWEDDGETLVVQGGAGKLSPPANGKAIYLGNAGTAARFVTTVCTLAHPDGPRTRTTVTGNARMKQRPIGPLVDALTANGVGIKYLESSGCLPLSIPASSGGFPGGTIQLAASVSSQYVSSILLSAPYAQSAVTLELTGGTVISQPYIDMTIAMMKTFGIEVERIKDSQGRLTDAYRIPKGVYKCPKVYNIESDASSSTYPLAIAAITGTTCTLQNIGSSSLQGDARFATDVLRPMGCEVVQTETETKVTGPPPGQLRALGEVDMEPMTDAFLTAAVLAAVASHAPLSRAQTDGQAPNSTRIVGIANQRVKECNRIKAMIDQLAKLGVKTRELDDGLEVLGVQPSQLRSGASIHCYDDHRVAMAFSVLGTVPGGPGLIVEEKRCVEKTWPSWWDDLTTKIGIQTEGVELEDGGPSKLPSAPHFDRGASILILGMRGAGKSFAGRVAAAALGWPLVDTDVFFMERHQTHVRTFVKERGWAAFRVAETEILRELLQTSSRGHIISLGGGVVEKPENREMLKKYAATGGPVVEIVRDIDEIIAYLDAEGTRPSLGEPIEVLWKRRQPWFRECANCEFVNYIPSAVVAAGLNPLPVKPISVVNGEEVSLAAATAREDKAEVSAEVELARAEMKRFFRFVCGIDTNHVDFTGRHTYFLSLTFPSIASPRPSDLPALSNFEQLSTGCDAIEFRADLLSPTGQPPTKPTAPPMEYVAVQLSALRRLSSLPVVFTVRTHSQGGMFPDDAEDEMFDLLRLGLRAGCEYVDVELGHSPEKTSNFCLGKGFSQIIASWHDWSGHLKWDGLEVREKYEAAAKFGDIVKLVSKATSMADNFAMMAFRDSMPKGKPLMTINMGDQGQMSRILTPVFSPVTHPLLPSIAAPGQLSFGQIQQSLQLLGQIQPKQFCLFGTPIAHSKSPLIHNTGFGLLGLPHHYGLHESPTVDANVQSIVRSANFGGASVTIPHKLDIIPLLDDLTYDAKAIGAVNTVIPYQSGGNTRLRGDNTDWLAMRDLIALNLPDQSEETSELVRTAGLVLGAGGTSRAAVYALHKLGFKTVYLFNRSRENAMKIVHALPTEYNIVVLTSLDSFPGPPPSAVISTIPASGTATAQVPNPGAGVLIPPSVLSRPHGGVVLDMAYAPKRTPLIQLAEATPGWKTIPGIEALIEQAAYQFRLWTGRTMPRLSITRTVMEVYDAEQLRK